MSIRMKFIWGFLLCIVVSAGVVSGISVWKLNELSGTSFQQASGNQLQLTNRFITLFFQANISKLRFLSELKLVPQTAGHFPNFSQTTQETMYEVASLSPQARELFELLQSMRQSSAELAEIFIGYADGSIATSNPAVFTPGFDGRQRSWFKDALAARDDWNIGAVYQTLSKSMAVPITYRVKDASGQVVAVIGADIMLGTIEELFRSMQFERTGYYTLVDDQMRVLCSPKNPDMVMNMLDNHDMSRFAAEVNYDKRLYKMGLALVSTLRGYPQFYYGDEIMQISPKGGYENCRHNMMGGWEGDPRSVFTREGRTADENEIYDYLSALLNFRKACPAFHTGSKMKQFIPRDGIYTFFRYQGDAKVMVVTNNNEEERVLQTAPFAEMEIEGHTVRCVTSGEEFVMGKELRVPGKTVLVLEIM